MSAIDQMESSMFDNQDSITNNNISTITSFDNENEDESINMTSIEQTIPHELCKNNQSQLQLIHLPQLQPPFQTKDLYQCSKCFIQFDKLSHIIIHTKFCYDRPYFQCIRCLEVLVSFKLVSIHLNNHLSSCSKVCDICCESFSNLNIYDIHIYTHKLNLTKIEIEEDEDVEVGLIVKPSDSNVSRKIMICNLRSGIDRCYVINKRISKIKHNDTAAKTKFICSNCNLSFTTRVRYNLHRISSCPLNSIIEVKESTV